MATAPLQAGADLLDGKQPGQGPAVFGDGAGQATTGSADRAGAMLQEMTRKGAKAWRSQSHWRTRTESTCRRLQTITTAKTAANGRLKKLLDGFFTKACLTNIRAWYCVTQSTQFRRAFQAPGAKGHGAAENATAGTEWPRIYLLTAKGAKTWTDTGN